ncbi:MAG: serine hydrolase domain-containing protein [Syntrophothermus sp.]
MKIKLILLLTSLLTVLFISANTFGQEKTTNLDEVDSYLNKTFKEQNFVGLGACLIKENKIQWMKTYGYADREIKELLRNDNIFQLASLSKVFTAAAIMQLYEKGLFSLDDDINNYLPFSVRNPNFPDKPITFRMLLTHTASFDDLLPMGNKISLGVNGDCQTPLSEYVKELFVPGGKYYSIDYFSKVEPGTKYLYSNISFSLLGYLVESIIKQDFSEYCKKNIFDPLNMTNTGWHLKDLDTNNIAYCYGGRLTDTTAAYQKIVHFGLPGYPEGMLRTTMEDLSHFIIAILNDGRYDNYEILRPETVKLMLTPQGIKNILSRSFPVDDIGITWHKVNVDGKTYYSMNGFSGSIFTNTMFSKENNTAIIYFFTGISLKNMQTSNGISKLLINAVENFEVE